MLEISNLKYQIGETVIINGIDLKINAGEKVGIIGPNGSGKTTLFNCISGFCSPQSGSIKFNGKDILHLSPHKRSLVGIGRVFQTFGIFKEMTLGENILTALESRNGDLVLPWSRAFKENCNKAYEYLKEIGLEDKINEKAGSLSGGQMRLLEISRAIAFGAKMFLLDEPTAGVSPKMKAEVERILEKLRRMNKTVLIIEHDMYFIQKLCERIVVLDVGKVVLDGLPDEIRTNPVLQEIYFGASQI